MGRCIVECVPNFSEGRDALSVAAIRDAIASVPGVCVLRAERDADHNRSVVTFAGTPAAVEEAAFRGIEQACGRIDLRMHRGEHPRIGAADVVPFVPVEGVTLSECVEMAHRTGARIWEQLGVPVYFYEAAALHPDRVRLENVRRGGFENPSLPPDLGGPALHPTAGACIIGARKFLIAFNVVLDTPDITVARDIARAVRASSGGLPHVKALGVMLRERNRAQVSMNLTDFESTPLHAAFDAVQAEAGRRGVGIEGSEIIGLVPRRALEMAGVHHLRCENFSPALVLEDRIASIE